MLPHFLLAVPMGAWKTMPSRARGRLADRPEAPLQRSHHNEDLALSLKSVNLVSPQTCSRGRHETWMI